MRLIDADALMERMYHDAFETDTDMQKWDSGCWIRYKMFENAMDSAPTIDAVSVVHGEWKDQLNYRDGSYYSVCSECGYFDDERDDLTAYNFCPYCGAKMDGEREGE